MEYKDWGLDDDPERRPLREREADYASFCEACDERIVPGDRIILEDDEWIHKECGS